MSFATAVKLWPTARAEDSESCGNHPGATDSLTGATRNWPTPSARDWKSETRLENRPEQHAPNLSQFVYLALLQDPPIHDGPQSSENGQTSRRHWPTPDTQNGRPGEATRTPAPGRKIADISAGDRHAVSLHHLTNLGPRRLNPRFVEWLMGFPIGWSEV
jgi:hypothetical protein